GGSTANITSPLQKGACRIVISSVTQLPAAEIKATHDVLSPSATLTRGPATTASCRRISCRGLCTYQATVQLRLAGRAGALPLRAIFDDGCALDRTGVGPGGVAHRLLVVCQTETGELVWRRPGC